MYYIKQIYLQLENALQFRLGRIKRIEDFFIVEINDGLKMSRTLNKYIIVLDYADKTCAGTGASIFSFNTVISTSVGIKLS